MNCTRNVAVLLALFAVACGGPTEPEGDAIVIITDENNDAPANNADANNDPANNDNNVDPPANNENNANNVDPPANNDNNVDPPANNENNVDPPANNENNVDPTDPCGNGVIEDGEVCDGDCPRSCDDGDPCTQDSMAGSPDACTAVCTNATDMACGAWAGTYTGTYFMKAEEKVGATVVNSMSCSGSFDVVVDPTQTDTISGTASCAYGGSLGGFDSTQNATITGKINPDGTFTMRIAHDPGTHSVGYFNVDGSVAGGDLVVDDTSSFRPHPMSAVPWEVTLQLN